MVDDCCLYVFCLAWCACVSMFGLSCVICEGGDDDSVIALECGLSDCIECLGEGEGHVGLNVVLYVVDAVFDFAGSEVLEVAVVKYVRRRLRRKSGRRRSGMSI